MSEPERGSVRPKAPSSSPEANLGSHSSAEHGRVRELLGFGPGESEEPEIGEALHDDVAIKELCFGPQVVGNRAHLFIKERAKLHDRFFFLIGECILVAVEVAAEGLK